MGMRLANWVVFAKVVQRIKIASLKKEVCWALREEVFR